MLDGTVRRAVAPTIDSLADAIARRGIGANAVTWTGFSAGIAAAAAIAGSYFLVGLVLLLFSRLCDGLDGAVARVGGKTDYGGFLDIVLDFAVYGAIPFGFAIANPGVNALAGTALILSFYVNGSTFLAFAVMAEKHGLESTVRGEKSIFFTTGLAEATETILVFAVACLVPGWFVPLAWIFAAICLYTAASRLVLAARILA